MEYLEVVSWAEFQHYKDRNPPWIKLHNQLLENYDYTCLPDAAKSHLLGIWMLASRTDNRIPNNAQWISNKLSATETVNLKLLFDSNFIKIHHASNPLADCSDDRTVTVPSEEESRDRGEAETEKSKSRFTPPSLQQVSEYCLTRSNQVDPQAFIDHYKTNGWMRGKNKIKDWKACVRTWEKNSTGGQNGTNRQVFNRPLSTRDRVREAIERVGEPSETQAFEGEFEEVSELRPIE